MSEFNQLQIFPESVETVNVPFGEWLPDLPKLNNPGAIEALNVVPSEGGYVPFPKHEPEVGAVLPTIVRGASAVFTESNTVRVYAGVLDGIYGKQTDTFSRLYASTSLSREHAWQFVRAGESMVALHPEVAPVAANVGGFSAFTPLGGNPPTAGCGALVGDFLMLGNLSVDPDDASGSFPARVRWGGFNNIDSPWVTDPATQADFQDMPAEGGPVVGIVGRDVATIFQARMIRQAYYEGLPGVFRFETLEDKRGALARDAIVDIGAFMFFPAEDGFYIWNGTNSTPIGDNKVNRYFLNRLSYTARARIVGAVDHANGCIIWAFPTDSSGNLNEMIIYSYKENRWSHAINTLEYIFNSATSSTSLDDLTGSLESYTTSFDSAFYRGGIPRLAGFDINHTYGVFTGTNMAATLDTGEFSGPDGRRVDVVGARPIVDLIVPEASMQAVTRDQMIGGQLSFSEDTPQEIDGTCPIMSDARYTRFRVNLPEDAVWRHATGVDVLRRATGKF